MIKDKEDILSDIIIDSAKSFAENEKITLLVPSSWNRITLTEQYNIREELLVEADRLISAAILKTQLKEEDL